MTDVEQYPYYLGGLTTSNVASTPKVSPVSTSGATSGTTPALTSTRTAVAVSAPSLSSQLSLAEVDERIQSALANFVPWRPTYTFISGQSTSDVTAVSSALGGSILDTITNGRAAFNGASLTVSGQATVAASMSWAA